MMSYYNIFNEYFDSLHQNSHIYMLLYQRWIGFILPPSCKFRNMIKRKMLKNGKENFISGSQTAIFDKKEIIEKQNKLRKLYEINKRSDQIQYFSKIKYQNLIYEVGEFIELHTLSPTEHYIAKLTKVICALRANRPEFFIEVEWVLKKRDLPENLLKLFGEYISEAEVFPSTEKIYLYVSSIKCKCVLLGIEEYGQLGMTNESIFYTRSRYNQEAKTLHPNPSNWASDCDCNKPTNPDLKYVECSKCGRWFHSECVQSKIINGNFLCNGCFGRGMLEEE